jgi:biotin carboxylase
MKKIVILEPGSSAIYISNAIKQLGYEPIILCSIREYSGDQRRYLEKNVFYEVDANNVENIINCIYNNHIKDVFGVISTADRFIVQSIQTAAKLGVHGMDPALLKLNSKKEAINLISHDSPPTLIFNRYAIPFQQLKSMLQQSNALVIKPNASAGAKGLFEVTTEEEIDHIVDFMKKEKQVNVLDKDWLAQPVIEGTLYSLEGFLVHGQINYIGLSRRSRIKYTESQNHFPVENETDANIYSALIGVFEDLVRSSVYKNGYFHSEILYDGKKAYLIDANFGRVGGSSIVLQVAKSSDKTIEDIYTHVLETTFFPERSKTATFYPKVMKKTMSISYGVNQASTFLGLSIPTSIKSDHIQLVDIGKNLSPMGYDNRSRVGILVGKPEEVMYDIQTITIKTNKGILEPTF